MKGGPESNCFEHSRGNFVSLFSREKSPAKAWIHGVMNFSINADIFKADMYGTIFGRMLVFAWLRSGCESHFHHE